MITLKLTALATIICYLIDLSGITTTIKQLIWKWLFKNKQYQDFSLKPFDCSLCMVHHILLIYLLVITQFTLFNYLIVCILSFLSSNITSFLITLKELLIKFENKINNLIDNI